MRGWFGPRSRTGEMEKTWGTWVWEEEQGSGNGIEFTSCGVRT